MHTGVARPLGVCAAVLVAALEATLTGDQRVPSAARGRIDLNAHVRPILSDRCFACHGPDAAKRKAKLRLDTRAGALAVLKPHDPDGSEFVRRISTDYADEVMPPPESKPGLTGAEKEILKQWIAEGAEYRQHWSFEPVRRPEFPAGAAGPGEVNPIDAFVRERLAAEGLTRAPRAAPETLMRRVAVALTGLPPTLAELDAFVSEPSPANYARAVDRYLASPAYGERMAVDWLDLARYSDTYGYQNDMERDVSPWRDWVIRAFNDNLPYDRFLAWQLAGDLLPGPRATSASPPPSIACTGRPTRAAASRRSAGPSTSWIA